MTSTTSNSYRQEISRGNERYSKDTLERRLERVRSHHSSFTRTPLQMSK
jgi:hypothetical protein